MVVRTYAITFRLAGGVSALLEPGVVSSLMLFSTSSLVYALVQYVFS